MKETEKKEVFLSDDQIIELYWQRNEQGISETDKKYGKYLYTIAYNIVHDRLDSEECLNDTYLGTWNRIPPTRPTVLQLFLSKIMRNIALDKFKKARASKRIPSELVVSFAELEDYISTDTSLDEEMAIKEAICILNKFLKESRDDDEFMFVCRYYYSDKLADIAKMLGVSEKTVYRSLLRMRNELKEKLIKEGYSNE